MHNCRPIGCKHRARSPQRILRFTKSYPIHVKQNIFAAEVMSWAYGSVWLGHARIVSIGFVEKKHFMFLLLGLETGMVSYRSALRSL